MRQAAEEESQHEVEQEPDARVVAEPRPKLGGAPELFEVPLNVPGYPY